VQDFVIFLAQFSWYNLSDEALEKQINIHLERNSITVSLGSINIIDATVIEAKQSRKRKGKADLLPSVKVIFLTKPSSSTLACALKP
jgi:hypothetical protein